MTPESDGEDFHYRFKSFSLSGGDTIDLAPVAVMQDCGAACGESPYREVMGSRPTSSIGARTLFFCSQPTDPVTR